MSVCLSVRLFICPYRTWPPTGQICRKCYFEDFSKICREDLSIINIWKEYWVLHSKTYVQLWDLAQFFLEGEIFLIKVVEKIKTFYFQKHLFENRAVYEIMWKVWYSQTGHRSKYNTAHALCTLNTWGYKHTFRMCNSHCFTTARMATEHGYCNSKSEVTQPSKYTWSCKINQTSCFIPVTLCLYF
jgi:hypothetical protein